MRMRKKKWALPFLEQYPDLLYKDPSIYKSKWKEKLGSDEIHLEIGMGKGDYLLKMSELYPDVAWIGIEKDSNAIAVALKKIVGSNTDNKCLINNDAKDLLEWFDENEIDIIHLNFSDPWPKNAKKYKKRRLSSTNFIDIYDKILKNSGKVILKTDNAQLFEFSILEFLNKKYILEDIWVNFRSETHDEDAISEYESKFIRQNLPIYRVIFRKGNL